MSALHNDAIVESGLSADGLLDLRSGDYATMRETHKKVDLAYSKNHEELWRGATLEARGAPIQTADGAHPDRACQSSRP